VLALRHAVRGAFAQVWALALGTVAGEAAVAAVVASTLGPRLSKEFAPHASVRLGFAAVLVLMGLSMIVRPLGQPGQRPRGLLPSLGQGAGLTLLNPGIAVGYAAILVGKGPIDADASTLCSLVAGVAIASAAWWIVGVPVLHKLVRMGKPEWMAMLVRVLGVVRSWLRLGSFTKADATSVALMAGSSASLPPRLRSDGPAPLSRQPCKVTICLLSSRNIEIFL
jgi:threonine/homoserine/homoserine lactone efflux protein